MIQPTHAMILAAGYGKRLRPITDSIPKPMVEVAGRSLINRCLDHVEQGGITDIVVNASYRGDQLAEHLQQRSTPSITLSHEDTPLETGGGIAKALPLLGNTPFFALNSDVITLSGEQHYFERMVSAWRDDIDAMLLLHPRDKTYGFDGAGDFVQEQGKYRRREKDDSAPYIFTGIQLLHPRIFVDCPSDAFSMNLLYDRYIEESGYFNERMGFIIHDGDWLHVGDMEGLAEAETFFDNIKDHLVP